MGGFFFFFFAYLTAEEEEVSARHVGGKAAHGVHKRARGEDVGSVQVGVQRGPELLVQLQNAREIQLAKKKEGRGE